MFEHIINEKAAEILESISYLKENVKLQELLSSSSIDEFDKKYFEAEVYWRIYIDYLDRKSNPHFDYTEFENSTHFAELRDYQKSFAVFQKDDLNELSYLISKIKLNYLIRPQNTLNWFIFRNEPTKIYYEMFLRLNYFSEYKYLIDFVHHYFKEKNIDENSREIITSAEFQKLIFRIDKEFLETIDFADFVFLCEPIFNYFGGNSIPIHALIMFLDDKGLKKTAYLLEKFSLDNSIQSMSKAEFEAFLSNTESNINIETNFAKIDITFDVDYKNANITDAISNDLITAVDEDFSDNDESIFEEELKIEQAEAEAEFIDEILEEGNFEFVNNSINEDISSDFAYEDAVEPEIIEENFEELSSFTYEELLEKLNTKVDKRAKTSEFLALNQFDGQIVDLSYTEDNFKNELLDFYKSL